MNSKQDLRPQGTTLTNSRWGNSDHTDIDAPRPDDILEENLGQRFFNTAAASGGRLFSKSRDLESGEWSELTWGEAASQIARVASFLRDELGIKKGDKVAVLSFTRVEWALADLAILSLGAISTPVYHSLTSSEAAFILWNSEAQIIFCENQEQLDKLAEIDSAPSSIPKTEGFDGGKVKLNIQGVICFEQIQSNNFQSRLYDWQEIIKPGKYSKGVETAEMVELIRYDLAKVKRTDLASIVYTSGTTGIPKGVVQTHDNHLSLLNSLLLSGLIGSGSGVFLFLPLAHSFARFIFYGAIAAGGDLIFPAVVNKRKSEFDAKQLFSDIQSSNPEILPSVPRIYEKVMTSVQGKTSTAGLVMKPIIAWAMSNWKPLKDKLEQKGSLGPVDKTRFALAEKVIKKIRTSVFGNELSHCVSGGAPLDEKVARFFDSLGILILEGYGLTETTPALSANTKQRNRFGTVGRVFRNVEVKLEQDGELLTRGPNIAVGYNRMPEATKKSFSEDGWFSTGDIAEIDSEGFIKITDRKKDLIVNAGGKNIPPQKIEGKLKTIPFVSQALVYGDRKPYLVGLLTLDPENIASWAASNLSGEDHSLSNLADHPKVRELLDEEIAKVHIDLASYEEIKRYRILAEDFTIENGLLSPTLKLKRRKVVEKFLSEIESIYRN